jgi:hypothetical protein
MLLENLQTSDLNCVSEQIFCTDICRKHRFIKSKCSELIKSIFCNTVCQSLAMNSLAYNKLYLPGLYKRKDPLSCEGSESDMYKL